MRLRCLALLLSVALAGCASQQWIPPTTPHGRLCVEECQLAENRCTGRLQMTIANCANNVETELHAYNDPNIDSEMACADSAYDGQAGTGCQQQHRQCFVGCGGVIQ